MGIYSDGHEKALNTLVIFEKMFLQIKCITRRLSAIDEADFGFAPIAESINLGRP